MLLAHLRGKAPSAELAMLPEDRAPPKTRLFEPAIIAGLLAHLKGEGEEPSTEPVMLPEGRAPPQGRLFD